MRDIYHHFATIQAMVPAVKTATGNGAAIDLKGFDSALIVITTGAVAGAGDFTAVIQESDTTENADFADVAAADLLGDIPATLEADSTYRVGYIGSKRKRYIRVRLVRDSGTSIALGAVAMLGHPAMAPVN